MNAVAIAPTAFRGHTQQAGKLVLYEQMVTAIAECAKIDEIKDIRDKAMALEMYHRQAQNFEAEREAANVRLRAERRAGELLKELARTSLQEAAVAGGRAKSALSTAATRQEKCGTEILPPQSPYAAALEEHGISRQKAHRYQALANVPAQVFEDALAGPEKPTAVRVMARAKVREAGDPVPEIKSEALWLWGRLRDFENKNYFKISPTRLLAGMTSGMQADVLRLAPLVSDFLSALEAANEPA